MSHKGNTMNEKDRPADPDGPRQEAGRISIWTFAAIVFFLLLVGGLIYWGSITRRSLAPAFTESGLQFSEAEALPPTIVEDASVLGEGPRILLAERTITAIDEKGESAYRTKFIQTDLRGERRFPFYETEDISFEQVGMYGSGDVVVYSALLGTEPYLITTEGEQRDDVFIPPSIGNVFSEILSRDGNFLAYLEVVDPNAAAEDFVAESTIVVRDMTTGEEVRVPSDIFVHGEIQYARFSLHSFSEDNEILYMTAVWPGQDFGDSESFFALRWREGKAEELTYSSLEELGAEDVLEFIGVYPEFGFALFNHGPLIPEKSGGLTDRVRLDRFDLATKMTTTVYEATSGSVSGLLTNPVSPDGTRVVVENDLTEGGFRVVDLQTNEVLPNIPGGIFLSWAADRDHVVYEVVQDGPDVAEPSISLKAADLGTGTVSEIYRQTVLQEGTGLNAVGDVLYSFVGVKE